MVDVGCSCFDEENSILVQDNDGAPLTKVAKRFYRRDASMAGPDRFKDFPEDCGVSAVGRGRKGIG